MKIAIMSTYHQECGIAGYAETLRFGFEHNGHEVKILGNYPYAPLVKSDDDKVFRCFHMETFDKKNDWDVEGAINWIKGFDILLIQYEACLYPSSTFNQALERIKAETKCKIVLVFHSSCIWPSFPWNLIDYGIAHDEGILTCIPVRARSIVRHGMVDYPDQDSSKLKAQFGLTPDVFTVSSFGLGRVRYETTIPAVLKAGFQYLISSAHTEKNRITEIINKLSDEDKKKVFYYPNFVERDELVRRIQASDTVLLDYPPTTARVCSGAARIAIGVRRFTVVSYTNWFSDLVEQPFIGRIKPDLGVDEMTESLKKIPQYVNNEERKKKQEEYISVMCWNAISEKEFIPIFQSVLR